MDNPSQNKKSFEKKWSRLLLITIFFALPFFDLCTGFLLQKSLIGESGLLSPSQIGRVLCVGLMIYALSKSRFPYKFLVPILFFIGVEVLSFFYHQNIYGFLFGVLYLTKLIYLCLLITFLYITLKINNSIDDIAFYVRGNLWIISIALIMSFLTGMGESTYGWGFGTKSYFASGNGLGLYLGSMILFLVFCNYYGFYKTHLLTFFVFLVSLLLIATKTALIFFIVNIVFIYILSKFKFKRIIALFLILILSYFANQLYQEIKTIFDIVFSRFDTSFSIFDFAVSGRNSYVTDAFEVFLSQSNILIRSITGSGAFLSFQDPLNIEFFDTLETDFFDILFIYGIFGIALYIYCIFIVCWMLRKYKLFGFLFILIASHSLFAGHVIFNGMSVNAFGLLIAISLYLKNETSKLYYPNKFLPT
jgi:hypothetical protein